MGAFLKTETAGVDRREAGPRAWPPQEAKNPANLIRAEDDRQILLAGRTNKVESREVFVESVLEEEPDAAQGDGGGAAQVMLDIPEIEEILSQLILGDRSRGFVKVLRELAHGPDVAFLSAFGEAPELERLDHFLT